MSKLEQVKGKAEQLKGDVEQAAGKMIGSEKTQNRGVVDEVKGIARERVADVKGDVKKVAGEARVKTAEIKRKAEAAVKAAFLRTEVTGLNFTSIVIGAVGAAMLIVAYRALMPRRRWLSR